MTEWGAPLDGGESEAQKGQGVWSWVAQAVSYMTLDDESGGFPLLSPWATGLTPKTLGLSQEAHFRHCQEGVFLRHL